MGSARSCGGSEGDLNIGRDGARWLGCRGRATHWCRCRVPRAGRTGCRSRILRRLAKSGWRPHSATGRDPTATPSLRDQRRRRELAAVTPYLSQCPDRIGVASGESWGRLARTDHAPVAASPAAHRAVPGPRRPDRVDQGGPPQDRMLRIVHTADVHLGARHDDLGEQASAQRERQFAAFKATVDLAIAEKVDLVLIAGDLFDSNVQPRRSVERVAAELGRLVARPDPHGDHPGHARRLRPRLDLSRLRPQDPGRQRAGRRPRDGPDPGAPDGPSRRDQDDRARPGVRHQARPGEPAQGLDVAADRPAPPGTSGWSTARSRSPARRTGTRS